MERPTAGAVAVASMGSADAVTLASAPTATATTTTTGTSTPGPVAVSPDLRYYAPDTTKLKELQKNKPWMTDPKFFKAVAVSPSAIMKMVMHCARGVEKGIAQGGNPIEVMGLLLGRPDPLHPTTLIVTDAFPLPIEGFETRVIADDENVVNHMINLNESLERSRNEKFMGWYHSHPFDLGDHSHCFLSQTDLSTQLQWQRAEDPHGNPFVAMVLDPLRSTHLGIPEIKAFRAFPPEYQSPTPFECPDGTVQPVEQTRLEHWGSCWNRYYELTVEYYMSTTSRSVLSALTQNYLWISNLKRGDTKYSVNKLQQAAAATQNAFGGSNSPAVATTNTASTTTGTSAMLIDMEPSPFGAGGGSDMMLSSSVKDPSWQKPVAQILSDVATRQLAEATATLVQQQVFAPDP